MTTLQASWPVCGSCCEVALFPWMGNPHHCVVAEPEEALDNSRLRIDRPELPERAFSPSHASRVFENRPFQPDQILNAVRHINRTRTPIQNHIIHFSEIGNGLVVEVAMQWNAGFSECVPSFVNNIDTTMGGGTHVDGFRNALSGVVNRYVRKHKLLRDTEPDLDAHDICEGLAGVIAVTVRDAWFANEAEKKLGNPEVGKFVYKACKKHLKRWFKANPAEARVIVDKAISATDFHRMPRRSHCRI